MKRQFLVGCFACVGAVLGGPARAGIDDYFPRHPVRLPAQTVGVVCVDGELQRLLGQSPSPTFLCTFSSARSPYLWVWLPGPYKVGYPTSMGTRFKDSHGAYVFLNRLHVPAAFVGSHRYSIVDATLNEGHGSLDSERVQISAFRVLDGTAGYPVDTAAVVAEAESTVARVSPRFLQQASTTPETGPPGWLPANVANKVATYVTWLSDTKSLEIRCRRFVQDKRVSQIGTRRVLVHPGRMNPLPVVGQNYRPPPPPPPDHWETVPRMQTITYGAAVDMTFTWRAGQLTSQDAVPHLYRYHVADPASDSDSALPAR